MKSKVLLSSLLVMLLWGLLFPLVKLGYRVLDISATGDILTFAGFRFVVCGLLITLFSYAKAPSTFQPLKRCWVPVLLSGLFSIALHYGFSYLGLTMTDGSKTAILKQFGSVFYICFAGLFFPDDKLTFRKVAGLVLGLLGILAINTNAGTITFHIGDALIIASSFCIISANVISKKVFSTVEPIVSTGISQLFGGIVLLIVGIACGGDLFSVLPRTSGQFGVWAAIIGASVVSYCLWYITVQKEKLSKLFIVKFLEPLFASLFGWMLLGEDIFNLPYAAAFLLISGGIVIANLKTRQKTA